MTNSAKILVIRFSSIGDIVLTTPLLRILKAGLDGQTEIHYLTKKKFASLLAHNPNVDKVLTIEEDVTEVKSELKQGGYHYVIDLHHNMRSAIARKMAGGLDMVLDKRNPEKWLLVNFGIDKMPNEHIAERCIRTASLLGIENDLLGAEFYPDPEAKFDISDAGLQKDKFIVLSVGAAHEGKRMTPDQISEFCKLSAIPVVLIGGPEDIETGKLIACDLKLNWIGKTSIDQSALLMKEAALVVSGDSGMMHIAAALGKKVLSVWGCTSPRLGMYPYRPHSDSVILEPEGRRKRPCSKLGNRCKYGMKNKCISTISGAAIAQAASSIIQKGL